jgi:ClpP class serine protease
MAGGGGMKEVLYAMHRPFLERYLKEKSAATIADIQAITDLWSNPIALPGTPEAVDKIYSLDGDTAHIAIKGILSPEGPDLWDLFWGYGGTSYRDITAALDRAKNDPLVKSIILDINSPGGTVDGVDETWQAIRSVGKPVTTRAGGLLASAAYYLASGTGKILAEAPTSEIGSIGVLVATYDWSKWEENIGIKEIVITSSNAPDKHPDLTTTHGRDTIRAQLNAIERIFYARVSEGRGVSNEHIAEHFGRGGILVASDPSPEHEDAIRSGMIDGLVEGHFRSAAHRPLSAQEQKEIAAALEESMKPGATFYSADGKELSAAECEEVRQDIINIVNEAPYGAKNTPAQAGTKQEGQTMNLSDFLAANPASAAEVEALKAKAKAEGREEALAEQSAQISRVMGVITSEAYPANIKALAGDVLARKKGIDAFDAAVAVYDSELERRKSEAAQAETAAAGALAADKPGGKSADELAMESAGNAAIEKAKARNEEAAKWA